MMAGILSLSLLLALFFAGGLLAALRLFRPSQQRRIIDWLVLAVAVAGGALAIWSMVTRRGRASGTRRSQPQQPRIVGRQPIMLQRNLPVRRPVQVQTGTTGVAQESSFARVVPPSELDSVLTGIPLAEPVSLGQPVATGSGDRQPQQRTHLDTVASTPVTEPSRVAGDAALTTTQPPPRSQLPDQRAVNCAGHLDSASETRRHFNALMARLRRGEDVVLEAQKTASDFNAIESRLSDGQCEFKQASPNPSAELSKFLSCRERGLRRGHILDESLTRAEDDPPTSNDASIDAAAVADVKRFDEESRRLGCPDPEGYRQISALLFESELRGARLQRRAALERRRPEQRTEFRFISG